MTTQDKNLLQNILFEARAYNSFEDIEKLVERSADLSMLPIQPLYVSLLNAPADQVAVILPKLSKEQRQALLDLDLWKRDMVDVQSFEYWIEVYSQCQNEELVYEFVQNENFFLYLKSRINVYTFDAEDPQYPDHDNYFLTDDGLLLIEYSDEYNYAAQLKYFIRNLYSLHGVEEAYSIIFKLINDSFSLLQEEAYQDKIDRLRDYGFVDYFEAMQKLHPYASYKQLESFILNKKAATGNITLTGQNQSLHSSALVSFDSEIENILKELAKVQDEKRQQFLHFTFIRLINSTITLTDSLRGGRIELTKLGKQTKAYLELGIQFSHTIRNFDTMALFDLFDFIDLYKIGKSLVDIQQTRINKALAKTPFELDEFEYFLGQWWSSFLENSFLDIPKTKAFGAGTSAKIIDNITTYHFWIKEVDLFVGSIPFINQFHSTLFQLKQSGKLNDSFYLNYEIDNIDFEAVLISSFINYCLGHYQQSDVNKMGLSIDEFQKFIKTYFKKAADEYYLLPFESEIMQKQLVLFTESFGLSIVPNFVNYLYGVLSEHLSGYEFDGLANEDYQHVGGPILLALQTKN
jgi:hypothetical protein